jgi:hypothetical protein
MVFIQMGQTFGRLVLVQEIYQIKQVAKFENNI